MSAGLGLNLHLLDQSHPVDHQQTYLSFKTIQLVLACFRGNFPTNPQGTLVQYLLANWQFWSASTL